MLAADLTTILAGRRTTARLAARGDRVARCRSPRRAGRPGTRGNRARRQLARSTLRPRNEMERAVAVTLAGPVPGRPSRRWTTTSSISAGTRSFCSRRTPGCARRLRPDLPIVALLQYPTIRALARYLSGAASTRRSAGGAVQDRAQKQREALRAQRSLKGKR